MYEAWHTIHIITWQSGLFTTGYNGGIGEWGNGGMGESGNGNGERGMGMGNLLKGESLKGGITKRGNL